MDQQLTDTKDVDDPIGELVVNPIAPLSTKNFSTLLVTFGGMALQIDRIPVYEFSTFLSSKFSWIHKRFYIDHHRLWYHKGIQGISSNIPETVEYLKSVVQHFGYVVFLGVSSGGYASSLFASLLDGYVHRVIAFLPQSTLLKSSNNPIIRDSPYQDILPFLQRRCEQCSLAPIQYDFYGDLTDKSVLHSYEHVKRLEGIHPWIRVHNIPRLRMKTLRDNGRLEQILQNALSSARTSS